MGMTIDLAMNNLGEILKEATDGENSVCYVTENDAETLQVAIDIMHKYQKIEEIVEHWACCGNPSDSMIAISEVLDNGNDD